MDETISTPGKSNFNQSMKEWIEKNGLPKVVYYHPDDFDVSILSELTDVVKAIPSRYLNRGSVIFSCIDPDISIIQRITPDYESPSNNFKLRLE